MKFLFYISLLFAVLLSSCGNFSNNQPKKNIMDSSKKNDPVVSPADTAKLTKSEAEWKKTLPTDVYYIAREKGTERAFTGKYWNSFNTGTYYCAVCGNPLFRSNGKFESSCGWPSFFEPITKESIIYTPDNTHGMKRTEVTCGKCNSHLGHVFEDGPPPTGLRYCINGTVLDFKKAEE
jgi:peptide-methionine (R)-S-oxide reductase